MATTEICHSSAHEPAGPVRASLQAEPSPSRRWLVVAWAAVAVVVTVMLAVADRGPGPRASPHVPAGAHVVGGAAYANPPLWGVQCWPQIFEWASLILAFGLLVHFSRLSWKERRLHPGLVMVFAATGMYVLDPIFNWAWYFPPDPRFLHWPVEWPYVNISPTVEPMLFAPAYTFWLLIPGLIVHRTWRWLWGLPRLMGSWIHRRPILALILLSSAVSIPWDFCGFWLGTVSQVFIFSQALAPLVRSGLSDQQPLFWEPLLFPMIITATCVLYAYRDDGGNILPHRIARRLWSFRRLPRLTEVAVAWAILALVYASTLGVAALVLRRLTTPDRLAKPWPYADTKVYDPDGLYEKAGQPGPYRGR